MRGTLNSHYIIDAYRVSSKTQEMRLLFSIGYDRAESPRPAISHYIDEWQGLISIHRAGRSRYRSKSAVLIETGRMRGMTESPRRSHYIEHREGVSWRYGARAILDGVENKPDIVLAPKGIMK